jgi:hypothetical protein
MWLLFGIITVIATLINLILYRMGKDYRLAMVCGLSFTALTLCAQYSQISAWVIAEDWPALMDVVPSMEIALWILTILSIFLNMVPLLCELRNKR